MINEYYIKSTGNKVQDLFDFLEANRNVDEGDAWSYWLDHQIEDYLKIFNLKEVIELQEAIFKWDDTTTGHIADSILAVNNPLIDSKALYAEIFILNQDPDWEEYLVQNIHLVNDERKRPIIFYERILSKIEHLETKFNCDYTYYKKQIISKI